MINKGKSKNVFILREMKAKLCKRNVSHSQVKVYDKTHEKIQFKRKRLAKSNVLQCQSVYPLACVLGGHHRYHKTTLALALAKQ